jgi:hypothetical protein
VPAASLVDTVNRILAAGSAANERYCLSGFGTTSCGIGRLDKNRTMVNGRVLDQNRIYTIAMPESVALQSGLSASNEAGDTLIDMIDQGFARSSAGGAIATCAGEAEGGSGAAASNPETSLPTRLERTYADRASSYLFIKPADFAFSATQVGEPADGQGLFNKLPIQNNGAKPSRRISVNVGVDAGLFDGRRAALRAVGTISYGRTKVNDQTSVDPNLASAGIRWDWKVPKWGGRFFVGPFIETQFGRLVTPVQASRKISGLADPANPGQTLPTVSVPGPTLSLVTPRRQFEYAGTGFELLRPRITSWLTFDPLSVSLALGRSQREHVDVTINGEPQGLALFQQKGAAGLLNLYYGKHLATLTSQTPYTFVDQPLRRYRIQAQATPDVKWSPMGTRAIDISLSTTYSRFVGPNLIPLAERQSFSTKLVIAVPFYRLATVNLTASEYLVQVNGLTGWFSVWTPGVSVSIPVVAARRAGWAF